MPALPLHETVNVCEAPKTILVVEIVHVNPTDEILDPRLMVPVYPLTGATVIVDVAVVPALTLILVGLAVTVKSCIVTVTVAV
jgi:hypothetical protein